MSANYYIILASKDLNFFAFPSRMPDLIKMLFIENVCLEQTKIKCSFIPLVHGKIEKYMPSIFSKKELKNYLDEVINRSNEFSYEDAESEPFDYSIGKYEAYPFYLNIKSECCNRLENNLIRVMKWDDDDLHKDLNNNSLILSLNDPRLPEQLKSLINNNFRVCFSLNLKKEIQEDLSENGYWVDDSEIVFTHGFQVHRWIEGSSDYPIKESTYSAYIKDNPLAFLWSYNNQEALINFYSLFSITLTSRSSIGGDSNNEFGLLNFKKTLFYSKLKSGFKDIFNQELLLYSGPE